MSYRDPAQALEPALTKILDGIREFDAAVRERVESGEWLDTHITSIDALRLELLRYERRLIALRKETW